MKLHNLSRQYEGALDVFASDNRVLLLISLLCIIFPHTCRTAPSIVNLIGSGLLGSHK